MIKLFNDFWPLFLGLVIGSIVGNMLGNSIVYWGSYL